MKAAITGWSAGASIAALVLAGGTLAACGNSLYYAAMEQVGQHKRDILVRRVEAGQEEQREAEEQFLSTYQAFKQVSGFDGGELEPVYETLKAEYEKSESEADDVRSRIASIEDVAQALFREWEGEIDQISSAELRRQSGTRLRETRRRYESLIVAMRRAESRMDPVLTAFRDQVLFLKHNLNAQAISSLEGTARAIEGDVDRLIRDMRASIREAEAFLATMQG